MALPDKQFSAKNLEKTIGSKPFSKRFSNIPKGTRAQNRIEARFPTQQPPKRTATKQNVHPVNYPEAIVQPKMFERQDQNTEWNPIARREFDDKIRKIQAECVIAGLTEEKKRFIQFFLETFFTSDQIEHYLANRKAIECEDEQKFVAAIAADAAKDMPPEKAEQMFKWLQQNHEAWYEDGTSKYNSTYSSSSIWAYNEPDAYKAWTSAYGSESIALAGTNYDSRMVFESIFDANKISKNPRTIATVAAASLAGRTLKMPNGKFDITYERGEIPKILEADKTGHLKEKLGSQDPKTVVEGLTETQARHCHNKFLTPTTEHPEGNKEGDKECIAATGHFITSAKKLLPALKALSEKPIETPEANTKPQQVPEPQHSKTLTPGATPAGPHQ
jgi:hypothetical protein